MVLASLESFKYYCNARRVISINNRTPANALYPGNTAVPDNVYIQNTDTFNRDQYSFGLFAKSLTAYQ